MRRGRRYTLRGIPENADATVWQLVTEEGNETINLLKGGDDTLTLLDAKQRILPSVSGFELILTSNPQLSSSASFLRLNVLSSLN